MYMLMQQLAVGGPCTEYLSNMTRKPSVVSVGTKDSSAALPRWSQKGRDSLSMMGHDSILTQRLGSPVSKSKACSRNTAPHDHIAAQPILSQIVVTTHASKRYFAQSNLGTAQHIRALRSIATLIS